jgi:hypothetical protein
MAISRILVSMGRKLCLFVYYVEQINHKQWMAKEVATLNGRMESRTVESKIKKRIQKQCEAGLSSFWFHFQSMIGGAC